MERYVKGVLEYPEATPEVDSLLTNVIRDYSLPVGWTAWTWEKEINQWHDIVIGVNVSYVDVAGKYVDLIYLDTGSIYPNLNKVTESWKTDAVNFILLYLKVWYDQLISEITRITTTVSPPKVNSFSVSPSLIKQGEHAVLTWNVEKASSVEITNVGLNLPLVGSQVVNPLFTTVYTLTATGEGGQVQYAERLTVETATIVPVEKIPKIVSFTTSYPIIRKGDKSTLIWEIVDADEVLISGIGQVPFNDVKDVYPESTTEYILTAKTLTREVNATVLVTVNQPTTDGVVPPPEFIAPPKEIPPPIDVTGDEVPPPIRNGGGYVPPIDTETGKLPPPPSPETALDFAAMRLRYAGVFSENSGDELLSKGKVKVSFKRVLIFSLLPDFKERKEYTLPFVNKKIAILSSVKDEGVKTYVLVIDILENPFPVVALVIGLLILFGIGGVIMTLDKVEKLVESPAGSIFVIALAVIAGVLALVFGSKFLKQTKAT